MEKKKLISCCVAGVVAVYAASLLLFGRLKDDGLEDKSVQGSMESASGESGFMRKVLGGWEPGQEEKRAEGIQVYYDQGGFLLEKGSQWKGSFRIEEGADWEVQISYAMEDDAGGEFQLDFGIGQEAYSTQLPVLWYDQGGERSLNRYGDALTSPVTIPGCEFSSSP